MAPSFADRRRGVVFEYFIHPFHSRLNNDAGAPRRTRVGEKGAGADLARTARLLCGRGSLLVLSPVGIRPPGLWHGGCYKVPSPTPETTRAAPPGRFRPPQQSGPRARPQRLRRPDALLREGRVPAGRVALAKGA